LSGGGWRGSVVERKFFFDGDGTIEWGAIDRSRTRSLFSLSSFRGSLLCAIASLGESGRLLAPSPKGRKDQRQHYSRAARAPHLRRRPRPLTAVRGPPASPSAPPGRPATRPASSRSGPTRNPSRRRRPSRTRPPGRRGPPAEAAGLAFGVATFFSRTDGRNRWLSTRTKRMIRERERERAKKKNLKKKTTKRLFRISTFLFTFAHKTHEARGCERIRWDLLRESVIGF